VLQRIVPYWRWTGCPDRTPQKAMCLSRLAADAPLADSKRLESKEWRRERDCDPPKRDRFRSPGHYP
jgi:hypothetical protein